jgi:hypothetical protein
MGSVWSDSPTDLKHHSSASNWMSESISRIASAKVTRASRLRVSGSVPAADLFDLEHSIFYRCVIGSRASGLDNTTQTPTGVASISRPPNCNGRSSARRNSSRTTPRKAAIGSCRNFWHYFHATIKRVNIRDTIAVVNEMQAEGVIERYAIGGAVGATFYLEPVATFDVDIFITFRPEAGSLIADPQPIFDYLKARGGKMEGEYIVIAGWPVQFLPAANPLVEEALTQAVEKDVAGMTARVFSAEHLAAIALQTGRAKDKARLLQFLETGALDPAQFQNIISRHGLLAAWKRFQNQFLDDTP